MFTYNNTEKRVCTEKRKEWSKERIEANKYFYRWKELILLMYALFSERNNVQIIYEQIHRYRFYFKDNNSRTHNYISITISYFICFFFRALKLHLLKK